MDDRERRQLFYEHVDSMYVSAVRDYKNLLEQKIQSKSTEQDEDTDRNEQTDSAQKSFVEAEKILIQDAGTIQPSRDTKYNPVTPVNVTLRPITGSNCGNCTSLSCVENAFPLYRTLSTTPSHLHKAPLDVHVMARTDIVDDVTSMYL